MISIPDEDENGVKQRFRFQTILERKRRDENSHTTSVSK
jgi:hypothetical protein